MLETVGIVLFALVIMLSIALHEVGHLVPAKAFGVKVTEYMIGFGPMVWSRLRGETEVLVAGADQSTRRLAAAKDALSGLGGEITEWTAATVGQLDAAGARLQQQVAAVAAARADVAEGLEKTLAGLQDRIRDLSQSA